MFQHNLDHELTTNPVHLTGYAEATHAIPEVTMVGRLGEVARGTMGLEGTMEQAELALRRAAERIVPVRPGAPKTCMDDGEAAGNLSGTPVEEDRAKMAGGSAMGDWLGDELTRSVRTSRGQVVLAEETEYEQPLDRLRATRRQRALNGSIEHSGAHVRLTGSPDSCGCGMADKLPQAMDTIIEEAERPEGDRLAAMVGDLMRVPFSAETHEGVVADARRLRADFETFGWNGTYFIEGIRNPEPGAPFLGGDPGPYDDDIEVTVGGHAPIALGVHFGEGTLARDRFISETGEKVLWIDEAAIWEEAQLEAVDPADIVEVSERYQAIMTANVAGGITLGGPHLQIGIIGRVQPPVLNAVRG